MSKYRISLRNPEGSGLRRPLLLPGVPDHCCNETFDTSRNDEPFCTIAQGQLISFIWSRVYFQPDQPAYLSPVLLR